MEAETECPYCGESISVSIDAGGGGSQQYIEDCSVCCKPFEVRVTVDEDGEPAVELRRCDG